MSLIPLLSGRNRMWDDDWSIIPRTTWGGRGGWDMNVMDPYTEVNRTLREMDNAMRYVNREVERLSGGQGQFSLQPRVGELAPDIIDEGGRKKIQYNFDTRGFKPEDITVKTQGGRLVVSGKHQEEGESHRVVREFHRMVTVPQGVKVEDLQSRLEPGGVLRVEAPYTPPAIEQKPQFRELPISHEK